jgi:hypothetical protein
VAVIAWVRFCNFAQHGIEVRLQPPWRPEFGFVLAILNLRRRNLDLIEPHAEACSLERVLLIGSRRRWLRASGPRIYSLFLKGCRHTSASPPAANRRRRACELIEACFNPLG